MSLENPEYHRWHRFDLNGKKIIKRFEIGVTPPKSELGFTEWTLGTGSPTGQALENIRRGVSLATKGKPKSLEQKRKMREAKLGVPKSEEHKRNMSISQKSRYEAIKAAREAQPNE